LLISNKQKQKEIEAESKSKKITSVTHRCVLVPMICFLKKYFKNLFQKIMLRRSVRTKIQVVKYQAGISLKYQAGTDAKKHLDKTKKKAAKAKRSKFSKREKEVTVEGKEEKNYITSETKPPPLYGIIVYPNERMLGISWRTTKDKNMKCLKTNKIMQLMGANSPFVVHSVDQGDLLDATLHLRANLYASWMCNKLQIEYDTIWGPVIVTKTDPTLPFTDSDKKQLERALEYANNLSDSLSDLCW
jgi:hypothetical protein